MEKIRDKKRETEKLYDVAVVMNLLPYLLRAICRATKEITRRDHNNKRKKRVVDVFYLLFFVCSFDETGEMIVQ